MIDLHVVEHHALAADHVVVVVGGKVPRAGRRRVWNFGRGRCRPGKMRKYLVISSGAPGTKSTSEKNGIQQRMRIAAGAVQQQDRIIDVAICIAMGRSQGKVVQLERGQGFAASKAEVGKNRGAVYGMPLAGGGWDCGRGLGRGRGNLTDCGNPEKKRGRNRVSCCAQLHSLTPKVHGRG